MHAIRKIDSIEVRFSLSEPVPIRKIDGPYDHIFTIIQQEGKEYLTEINFVISTQNLDQAASIGLRKARLLCNLISYKCKKGVIPKYRGYQLRYNYGHNPVAGIASFKVWKDNELELNVNEIKEIESDPNQSMYQHFSRSFILLKYDNYDTVIKELYQILEDKKVFPSNLKKYKYLRHALSHSDPIHKVTLSKIEKGFGKNYFVFTKGRFDHDSPTNIQKLRHESWEFMHEMWKQYGI